MAVVTHKAFASWRWLLPTAIGLAVAAVFILSELRDGLPTQYNLRQGWFGFAVLAFTFVALRTLASMIRLRQLSFRLLSWRSSFQVVMLWEFATAVSPGFLGAAAPALYLVHKEGINIGQSTAIVFLASFLDELFFIVFLPVCILVYGSGNLLPGESMLGSPDALVWFLRAGYVYMWILALIIVLGLFFSPLTVRLVLVRVFGLPLLRRWRNAAVRTGDELALTSQLMRRLPVLHWLKIGLSTSVIWLSRFLLVNMLILMIHPLAEHGLTVGRQIAMWVILLISPTPGSSGAAEFLFIDFLRPVVGPELSLGGLTLIWRLLSFYIYLIVGAIVLPMWLRRVLKKNRDGIA